MLVGRSMNMNVMDVFGVLPPRHLGQVKNCPLFAPAAGAPPAEAGAPAVPAPAPAAPKGVTLRATIANAQGETPRAILLHQGSPPQYLALEVFGIRPGAAAGAYSAEKIARINVPFAVMDATPDRIVSSTSLTWGRPHYGNRMWIFKLNASPMTFTIPPEEMKDLDGTPFEALAFQFTKVGSFYVEPNNFTLKDGEDVSRDFTVKVQSAMGRAPEIRTYPLGNLERPSGRYGLPLLARPVALETVPLLGALGSVGHPASPVWDAGLGQGAYPGSAAAAFSPAVAPAAPLEPHPLEPGIPIMPILGVVTAIGAVAYMIFR